MGNIKLMIKIQPSTTVYSLMNISLGQHINIDERHITRVNIGSSKSSSLTANESTKNLKSNQMDEDIRRAKSLVALAELREKFKQTGDSGLALAKQRVDKVFAKYAIPQVEK